MNRTDLEAIAKVIEEKDLFVLSDEIYSELTYSGKHVSIAEISGSFLLFLFQSVWVRWCLSMFYLFVVCFILNCIIVKVEMNLVVFSIFSISNF